MPRPLEIIEGNGVILELNKLTPEGFYLEKGVDGKLYAKERPRLDMVFRLLDGYLRPELDTFELRRCAGSGPTLQNRPGSPPSWHASLTLPRPGKSWDSALHFLAVADTPEEAVGRLLWTAAVRLSELEPWPPVDRPAPPPATTPGAVPENERSRSLVYFDEWKKRFRFQNPNTAAPSGPWELVGQIEREVSSVGLFWWAEGNDVPFQQRSQAAQHLLAKWREKTGSPAL